MEENEKVKGPERWTAAIANLTETASNLASLQKLLINKAVYVDDETFAKASLSSEQAHTIKVLEQRCSYFSARTQKRQAEAAHKAADLRA